MTRIAITIESQKRRLVETEAKLQSLALTTSENVKKNRETNMKLIFSEEYARLKREEKKLSYSVAGVDYEKLHQFLKSCNLSSLLECAKELETNLNRLAEEYQQVSADILNVSVDLKIQDSEKDLNKHEELILVSPEYGCEYASLVSKFVKETDEVNETIVQRIENSKFTKREIEEETYLQGFNLFLKGKSNPLSVFCRQLTCLKTKKKILQRSFEKNKEILYREGILEVAKRRKTSVEEEKRMRENLTMDEKRAELNLRLVLDQEKFDIKNRCSEEAKKLRSEELEEEKKRKLEDEKRYFNENNERLKIHQHSCEEEKAKRHLIEKEKNAEKEKEAEIERKKNFVAISLRRHRCLLRREKEEKMREEAEEIRVRGEKSLQNYLNSLKDQYKVERSLDRLCDNETKKKRIFLDAEDEKLRKKKLICRDMQGFSDKRICADLRWKISNELINYDLLNTEAGRAAFAKF